MKKSFYILTFLLTTLLSCSSDDDSNTVETPDEINQTEWEHVEDNRGYYIYFSVGNSMRISHPVYDVGSGEFTNINIDGEFTYDKPNVSINFFGECSNSGFVFSSCDVSGTIEGDKLTIHDNGTDYVFTNMYPNE
ncbi:hypothetical protein [Mangrovimonas futianensis]|uniref:hypothetical protein n=1 Tax=Mangrovimonas futianensis TaxID=2895523 RepID=UPI001E56D13B|nr:hypothetical protein [Mangrovimonas futianensis]MCF1420827.1 hypothetical protein [Mangrovimonas futianensis]